MRLIAALSRKASFSARVREVDKLHRITQLSGSLALSLTMFHQLQTTCALAFHLARRNSLDLSWSEMPLTLRSAPAIVRNRTDGWPGKVDELRFSYRDPSQLLQRGG